MYAVITKAGMDLKKKAKDIPAKIGACVPLSPEKAVTLYNILYEMMEKL